MKLMLCAALLALLAGCGGSDEPIPEEPPAGDVVVVPTPSTRCEPTLACY